MLQRSIVLANGPEDHQAGTIRTHNRVPGLVGRITCKDFR
jgi:hypothetical protein